MTDHVTKEKRSWLMSQVKGKNTTPELIVRKYLHKNGLRYSLHKKDLPGKPDIVLSKYRTTIFVNGCFWHGHEGCKKARLPKTRTEWWERKMASNKQKDKKNKTALKREGWNVIVIWQCKLQKNPSVILRRLLNQIARSK
jgi:DNA mismatch endonuclease (patch repair protein)